MNCPLLPSVAAGDNSALALCIERYRVWITSIARQAAPRHVDDLVQEIFVDVWRSAHRYDGRGSERAFVATIARRRIIDHIRRIYRRRHPQAPASMANATVAPQGPRTNAVAVTQVDAAPNELGVGCTGAHQETVVRASAVKDAIRRLRPVRRRAVTLSAVWGFSHSEIASAMGVPIGTAKSHTRRGVAEVRLMLDEA